MMQKHYRIIEVLAVQSFKRCPKYREGLKLNREGLRKSESIEKKHLQQDVMEVFLPLNKTFKKVIATFFLQLPFYISQLCLYNMQL